MKKITFIAAFFLGILGVQAQDFYTFSKSTATYADLTDATSLNQNIPWQWEEMGPVTTPFSVYAFGESYNNFSFSDDSFFLVDAGSNIYLMPIFGYLMDRNFSLSSASLSPISYKVEGAAGNRILKLEVKNAGLELEKEVSSTSTLFVNYQVWFYEADKSIEYHYGNSNITDLAMLNEESMMVVILAKESENSIIAGFVSGAVSSPLYSEAVDDIEELPALDAVPPVNTVYRFSVNSAATIDQTKVSFSIYPNPTTDVLNVNLEDQVEKGYSVYDMLGREVIKGNIHNETSFQIPVHQLQQGNYILKIGSSVKNFIKK